jgi:hypothetical protein
VGNEWLFGDFVERECQRELLQHVLKGDPIDVAAYAAFMWRRGWKTTGKGE